MQWLELSPEEVAFFAAPAEAGANVFATRLALRLTRTLSARLRVPVAFEARTPTQSQERPGAPVWQVDARLANVWLTRRLGGRQALEGVDASNHAVVPHSCIHTLNAVLAESWLDAPEATLAAAFAWEVTAAATRGTLALRLPHDTKDMTRWAREVIRHG